MRTFAHLYHCLKKTTVRKKIFITLWLLLILGVGAVAGAFWAISEGIIGYMPNLSQLEDPVDRFASQALSADGEVLGTWSYSRNNRTFVSYDQLPQCLVDALIATEDERFREHSGIDYKALFRAIIKRGIMRQKSAGGGSTITQQLAKLLYSDHASSTVERLLQKPIEWVIAVKLESMYTKDEIITLYLNCFDFLHNAVGVKMAAMTYFGKLPKDLNVGEAAVLVGMCKNPSYFNPMRHTERTEDRRNTVINQMLRSGYISEDSAEIYKAMPLTLDFHAADHKLGSGTYLRERLRQILMAKRPKLENYAEWQKQQYHDDSLAWATNPLYGWCNKNTKADGSHYDLYQDGLIIHTTIDSRMQSIAEEAVMRHLRDSLQPAFNREAKGNKRWPYARSMTDTEVKRSLFRSMRQSERYSVMRRAGASEKEIEEAFNTPVEMTLYAPTKKEPNREVDTTMTPMDSLLYYKRFLRSGFVCMETKTGHVKAYVGGANFAHFQYDMAGVGRRQVGSTIKPFLYSLAMENGMTPCDEVPNVQTTYTLEDGKTWTPRNGSRSRYGENVTLRWGLQQSNNWISAHLINQWGPGNFLNLLREYGVESLDVYPSPSLCLGTADISVLEMASAYTAFVNQGTRFTPLFVTQITNREGEVLATFSADTHEVISPEASYKMLDLLQAVINGGTGSRMRYRYGVKAPMGGKTGTTNDNSDGWFMCVTPELVASCWVGGEERDIHLGSMAFGQGAAAALPISARFFQGVYGNPRLPYNPALQFDIPIDFQPCAGGFNVVVPEATVEDVFN